MSEALKITPIDEELTRLPLPVLMKGADFSFNGDNFHHHFHHHFHPERSEELGVNVESGKRYGFRDERRIEGLPVRFCRGQDTPIWLHERYHQLFSGPPLPETTRDKFTTIVLACAGIVPKQAIDLYTPREYSIADLSDKQHEFIRRRIHFEGAANPNKSKRNHIGKFIANFAINNSLIEIVSEKDVKQRIDQLLKPSDEAQRRAAGHFILEYAIGASVAELVPIHTEAQKEGLVKNRRKSLADTIQKFFPQHRFVDYYPALAQQVKLLVA